MIYDLKELNGDAGNSEYDINKLKYHALLAIAERLEAPRQDAMLEFTSADGELFSIRESMIYQIERGKYGNTTLETHLGQKLVREDYSDIRKKIWGDK